MSILSNNYFKLFLIVLILVLAATLRIYRLDKMPPSLNWDEVAAAYNAFTIANYGQDEYGKSFPLVFKNFGDDKHPVHIYTTAGFVKFLGVSDFNVRLPNAVFGTLSVLVIFLLVKIWFKKFYLGLLAAFFLAVSPYHIHFSRGLWEVIFALFYFLLGLYGFYRGLEKKNWWLAAGYLAFGISLLSYHSAKVVTLPLVFVLTILYFKDLVALKQRFFVSIIIFLLFLALIVLNPALLGLARANQTKFSQERIEKTVLFHKTKIPLLGFANVVTDNYLKHFSYDYLFERGDQSPRNSVKTFGMFYKLDAVFLILGFLAVLFKRSKLTVVILLWFILAPLPSSLTDGAPNATRALFMMGSMQIISAIGAYTLIKSLRIKSVQIIFSILLLIAFGLSLKVYLNEYYSKYNNESINWQYGMKQIVEYVEKHPEYSRVYMTDVRSQPYIFFLYYLKVSPAELQKTVIYNQDSKNKSFNLIYSFDRYQFGGWDEIQSRPDINVLYIIEEGKYGGLAHKNDFLIVNPVEFPNGEVAFYMVSAN